jgi:hypothetical protein
MDTTTTTKPATQLQTIAKESGLSKESSEALVQKFIPFFQQANEWSEKAKALTVTDISQITEMQQARDARLALKKIRVNVENTRKDLKEDSLKTGKAIDGIANVLKGLIEPIEEHLEQQEKFAEIEEAKRVQKLINERLPILQEYTPDAHMYPLGTISEEAFADLVNGFKVAAQAKIDAEKKAEKERLAKEKADAAERLRIQKENDSLKAANALKEKELAATKAKAAAELKATEEKAAKEKAAGVAKLKAEVAEKNKIAAELKSKEEAAALAKKEALAAERKAQRAPDKEKLLTFADMLVNLEHPGLKSDEAKVIMGDVDKLIQKISIFIKEKTTNL